MPRKKAPESGMGNLGLIMLLAQGGLNPNKSLNGQLDLGAKMMLMGPEAATQDELKRMKTRLKKRVTNSFAYKAVAWQRYRTEAQRLNALIKATGQDSFEHAAEWILEQRARLEQEAREREEEA